MAAPLLEVVAAAAQNFPFIFQPQHPAPPSSFSSPVPPPHSKPNRFHSFSRTHIEWGGRKGRKERRRGRERERNGTEEKGEGGGGRLVLRLRPTPLLPPLSFPFFSFLSSFQFSPLFPLSFFSGSTKLPFFHHDLFSRSSWFFFSWLLSLPSLLRCLPCEGKGREREIGLGWKKGGKEGSSSSSFSYYGGRGNSILLLALVVPFFLPRPAIPTRKKAHHLHAADLVWDSGPLKILYWYVPGVR